MDLSGHPSLTFRHWAGVSTYTSAFALAGTCVCGKQSLGPLLCDRTRLQTLGPSPRRLPLSRSYGYILPSSLTRVLPRTLGFSPRIPVSVYGTGGCSLTRSFSRQCGVSSFAGVSTASSHASASVTRICLRNSLHAFTGSSILLPACPPASLRRSNNCCRYWNINQLSISYALCLGLGPDLPWDDDRCPGILMLSVGRILTFLFATHTNILTSLKSTMPYSTASALRERSPTPHAQSM